MCRSRPAPGRSAAPSRRRFRPVRTGPPFDGCADYSHQLRVGADAGRTKGVDLHRSTGRPGSGRQPGPDPKVNRSSADHVAAGTPRPVGGHRLTAGRDVLAAPAADAITAFSGGRATPSPPFASTRRHGSHQAGAAGRPRRSGVDDLRISSRALTRATSARRTRADQTPGRRASHTRLRRGRLRRVGPADGDPAAARARRAKRRPAADQRFICSHTSDRTSSVKQPAVRIQCIASRRHADRMMPTARRPRVAAPFLGGDRRQQPTQVVAPNEPRRVRPRRGPGQPRTSAPPSGIIEGP